ncbi:hypothetical protein [Haloechinothrix alba]|nr:hypothetical protein [Haloechinothrix alba]
MPGSVDHPMSFRSVVAVFAVMIVLAVGGGVLLHDMYSAADGSAAAPDPPPVPVERDPEDRPGSGEVRLSGDAARHPERDAVRRVLQTYFDAINERDFDLWRSAVTSERLGTTEEDQWIEDFRSTRDGDMYVHRIAPARDDRLRVLVSFTSTQDVEDAPATLPEPCIHWWLALPLAAGGDGDGWRIDAVSPGTPPLYEAC